MSQRKLQQEIDKVLKKVKEGLEIFDGYYEKLQGCESQSQKEKLEGDLKREIKKLQRLRDQIKSWLSGNEVKDKNALLENRRLIENAMERFKTVEKDMKTKAFSKEGLNMQRIDPKQKEKNETTEFLQQMLEELERQSEKHEASIDQIQGSSKRGKRLDASKQNEINELQEKINRNHWHQEKLELMLRLLENGDLEPEQVNTIQEDIKYYVESNEDADFADDEGIYDELGLDEAEEAYGNVGEFPQAQDDLDDSVSSPVQSHGHAEPSEASKTANLASTAAATHSHAGASNASTPVKKPIIAHANSNAAIKPVLSTKLTTHSNNSTPILASATLKPAIPQVKTELKFNTVVAASVNSAHNTPTISNASINHSNNIPPPGLSKSSTSSSAAPVQQTQAKLADSDTELIIASILKDLLPSFEAAKSRISKPQPINEISKVLETSLLNCPDSLDAEKPKSYTPTTPHPTSIHYPQEPSPELNYQSIIAKLDLSTLFYNFYFVQDEYVQILSAKELVNKGWLFDTISKKWFIKTEEISNVNESTNGEATKTIWKYFDYEGVWLPRRSDDFDIKNVNLESTF